VLLAPNQPAQPSDSVRAELGTSVARAG